MKKQLKIWENKNISMDGKNIFRDYEQLDIEEKYIFLQYLLGFDGDLVICHICGTARDYKRDDLVIKCRSCDEWVCHTFCSRKCDRCDRERICNKCSRIKCNICGDNVCGSCYYEWVDMCGMCNDKNREK